MTDNVLCKRYEDWISGLVLNSDQDLVTASYKKLFRKLFSVPFLYVRETDKSRVDDGYFLRYRFVSSERIPQNALDNALTNKGHVFCSVLEMMIALALRIEEHIMSDSDFGNRTGQWFWEMIVSLGLSGMDDDYFDERQVDSIINDFIAVKYDKNGKGGLFTVSNPRYDMRRVDIWYQMQYYISEKYM